MKFYNFRLSCLVLLLFVSLTNAGVKKDDTSSTKGTSENPYIIPQSFKTVNIDGLLNDEAWSDALKIDMPYEIWPGENLPAIVHTEALLVYTKSYLYVGFKAHDPNPSEIQAHYIDRDNIWDEDFVLIFLDTFNDERRAFSIMSNPLGVQGDDIRLDSGSHIDWDAIYESEGQIHDWGYTIEIAIPFNQLRFQRTKEAQVWGINLRRIYPRNLLYHFDPIKNDRNNDSDISQFFKIKGFQGAAPGRNIEIVPTLVGGRTDERTKLPDGIFERVDQDIEVGLSARWGFTPNLTLNGTVNPDFSQVEADALQLDINEPFALDYPEKRPFFTEGSDYFSTLKEAVYTRTIRDPLWGTKLTGKEGKNTIGAYVVRDDITNLIFPGSQTSADTSLNMANTSAVFRYKRDIDTKYTFGLMATDREGQDYFNRLVGFDSNIRVTNSDRVQLQIMGSNTQYPQKTAAHFELQQGNFSDHFFAFEYDHDARNWGWWLDYDNAGPGFRADMGFIPRVGFQNVEGGVNYTWIGKPKSWWTQFSLDNQLNYYEDENGGLLKKNASLRFQYRGTMRSHSHFQANVLQEIYNGVLFDLKNYSACFGFWPNRNIWFHVYTLFGDRIDYDNTRLGKRLHVGPNISLNLGIHLQFDLQHTVERMTVAEKRLYAANISQLTAVYYFNVRTFFRSIFQYVDYDYNVDNYTFDIDPQYRHFFSQLLFSYKINPFTVFFIGYTDNYFGSQNYGLTKNDRSIFLKLSYAWVL